MKLLFVLSLISIVLGVVFVKVGGDPLVNMQRAMGFKPAPTNAELIGLLLMLLGTVGLMADAIWWAIA